MFRHAFAVVFVLAAAVQCPLLGAEPEGLGPREIFEQRIMPIFRSPEPASCVQCHLAGVDLKDYILPSHEQTFASLRDQGMIDLAEPAKSKILTLIAMGERDADKGARLIHEETRKAEYAAFEAWILACCADPALRELPLLTAASLAKPARPEEVIRHARKSRVVDSFARNVWSQRMRCFPCHTPHEIDPEKPEHRIALEKHQAFLKQDGGTHAERMPLFRETPEATLAYLVEKSRRAPEGELPLINLKDPANSLLLLKPTAKLPPRAAGGPLEAPSYNLPVSHLGGLKMHVDDQSYKAFLAWLEDYARTVGDEYASVEELPADNWRPTRHAVLLRDVPDAWPAESRVQLFVHGWDAKAAAWTREPLAFTQAPLNPRRAAAGLLFLLGPSGSTTEDQQAPRDAEEAKLPPGKYLIKVYVDREKRLTGDPTLLLGPAEFAGELEIEAAWGEGFPQAEKLSGEGLK